MAWWHRVWATSWSLVQCPDFAQRCQLLGVARYNAIIQAFSIKSETLFHRYHFKTKPKKKTADENVLEKLPFHAKKTSLISQQTKNNFSIWLTGWRVFLPSRLSTSIAPGSCVAALVLNAIGTLYTVLAVSVPCKVCSPTRLHKVHVHLVNIYTKNCLFLLSLG